MSLPGEQLSEVAVDPVVREIKQSLQRLEQREWWLWVSAVIVMLALTVAVVSFTVPMLLHDELSYQFQLSQAVRGLVGLVLLFSTYGIYQQLLIHRLRRQLTSQIAMTASLHSRAEEFYRLATRDALTGLYNRRFVQQRLAEEVSRSERHGRPLAVLLLDLNDFKHINDRYGHPAGDLVLKKFAGLLAGGFRTSDIPARVGGDEFLVLLPECPLEQVPNLLRRLHALEVDYSGRKIPVTFAAGWAGFQKGERADQLLERADQALYEDKRAAKAPAQPAPLPG